MTPSYTFACPNWFDLLKAGKTPIPDLPLDQEAARKALVFFNNLRLPDVLGQPKLSEACGGWFKDILRAFIAARDPETQKRLVREMFVLVPKKNSKTTYSAALGLTALYMSERPNAEMMILGPTQNIADRCFDQAHDMILADARLKKIFDVQAHLKKITRKKTNASLRVKTFDMNVVTGEIPSLTIIDELHLLGSKRFAENVLRQVRGGGITGQGGQILFITTQSDREPAGVFKKELQKARAIRDGRATKTPIMLPVLYEFPEAMQLDENKPWRDPKNWPLVLPNLGRSIDLVDLKQDYLNDGKISPESECLWASQHLNIEVGLALHADRWIGADYWQACAEPALTKEEVLNRSEIVVAGFDGGGLDDLAGLALIGRCCATRKWLFWAHAWAQTDVFEKRPEIAPRLQDFAQDKDLTICAQDDPQRDFRDVTDILVDIHARGLLPAQGAVGLDSYGVADLVDMLLEAGLSEEQLVGVPQGFKLSSAIWGMERKLKDRSLLHGGAPLMNWVLGNAKAELRGNNVYISKSAAGKAKIDPLTAGFNAFQLMARNPVPGGRGSMLLDMEEVLV